MTIIVNWQNPVFAQKTYNKGIDGLGNLYKVDDTNSSQIIFLQEDIESIKNQLDDTITRWSNFDGDDISAYFGLQGESLSSAMVRKLKQRLSQILFRTIRPDYITWFPFSDTQLSDKSKANVMRYMLDILRSYQDVTNRILN